MFAPSWEHQYHYTWCRWHLGYSWASWDHSYQLLCAHAEESMLLVQRAGFLYSGADLSITAVSAALAWILPHPRISSVKQASRLSLNPTSLGFQNTDRIKLDSCPGHHRNGPKPSPCSPLRLQHHCLPSSHKNSPWVSSPRT